MAIVRGNIAGNAQAAANMSWNHNNVSAVKGILPIWISRTYGAVVSQVTYAGLLMTRKKRYSSVSGDIDLWYLVNPPAGVNLVQLTHGVTQAICGVSVDYAGVDTLFPFGTIQGLHATVANSGPANLTEVLTTQNGWMCVDAAHDGQWGAAAPVLTQGGGQAHLRRQTHFTGGAINSGAIAVSEEASVGTTTTMSWTGMAGVDHWGHLAAPLKPAVDYEARPVEYTIDAWDPDQRVYDSRNRIVPRYKIKPNNWIRIIGIGPSTAEFYESMYDDPSLAYIEAVGYDGETDEVSIETNKGDLPEVIMARLASGSTG